MSYKAFAEKREQEMAAKDPVFGFTEFKCKYLKAIKPKQVCKTRCQSRQHSVLKPISFTEAPSSRNTFI